MNGVIMEYRFKELVDIPKLQKLADELFAATSIPLSIIAMDGEILIRSGWQKICTGFHRKHPEIEKECIEIGMKIREKVEKGEPFVISKCPRGLVDASAPIIIEGRHVANVSSGQVFLSPPDDAAVDFFRGQARKFGFDETKYLEAFREIPVFTEEKFRSGISFMTSLAQIVADLGLSRILEMRRESDQSRLYLDIAGVIIMALNEHGEITLINKKGCEVLECSEEKLLGKNWFENFLITGEIENIKDVFQQLMAGQNELVEYFENRVLTKTGREKTIAWHNTFLRNETGRIVGTLSSGSDITVQKKAEKALKDERDLIERIMETSPAGIVRVDVAGRLVYANRRAEEILGIKLSEMPGRTFNDPVWKITDFDGNPMLEENLPFPIVTRTGRPVFDIRHVVQWPNGRKVFLSINVAPLVDSSGAFEGMVATLEDITRPKLADDALKESEARFRSFMDHFPDHAFIKDKQSRYVYGNRTILDFWKTVSEKYVGTTAHDYFSKEVAQDIDRRDRIVLDEHRVIDQEVVIQNQSGETELRREIRFPLEMPNGEWLIGGLSIDISELMRGKEERQRLIAAIEQTGESVVITSLDGAIQYVNPAFETITGYLRHEITGMNPRILKSGHHDKSVYKTLWDTILSGNRWTGRMINRRKDGTHYTSESAITPIKDIRGDLLNFIWISRDISEEIELEKRVAQAQKMESIGNLAGGIAHDFNNILFPILGLAEMLRDDLPSGSLERENAEEIYKAGKRGSDLVKQILSFGRKGDYRKIPIRVQQVLREVLTLTRATIPVNIEMNQDIQKECGKVLADPTQLHQIAMNLITNAFHAVEETGGKISVVLRETTIASDDLATGSILPGRYAMLTVSDTGCGMSSAVMDRIFDPYFTTKSQGKGTGLGLAVVYGIVREHHGEIRVRSEVGKGATFDVFLPLAAKSAEPLSVGDDTDIPSGNERILLVDDEKPVVRLGRQILERLGYRVTTHTHSVDALNAFRADPEGFDLVITDMTMPIMTGERLAREMMSIKPDIPVIICTGYSERINQEKADAIGVKGLLMKPISKTEMGGMVRGVLDSVKDG
jgi:PAS domain S-box-containing protein